MTDNKRKRVNVTEVAGALGLYQSYCPNCRIAPRGDTFCDCGKWDDLIAANLEKLKRVTHPGWAVRT